ncbi:MAG: hypothetical protein AAF411_19990, partial [Myxococcota bacterium]
IGGGVALNLIARNQLSDLETERDSGQLEAGDSRVTRGRIFTVGSYAAFGAGALFGLLSIYYFVRNTTPDSDGDVLETREWSAGAAPTPGGAAVGIQGTF